MNNSHATPEPVARPRTTIDKVFEQVLSDIVGGTYPPGARLPAERELAQMLGASRPTLREALRRLAEWGLVVPKRGSGIVVRSKLEWSIEVLPAYLRYGHPVGDEASIQQMLIDLLYIRRTTIEQMIPIAADRIRPGSTAKARAAVHRAWEARRDLSEFTVRDFDVMRAVVEAANFLPGVWLLNRLSRVYVDIAAPLTGALEPPENYVESHLEFLAALERGDGDHARKTILAFLEAHDKRMLAALGVFT